MERVVRNRAGRRRWPNQRVGDNALHLLAFPPDLFLLLFPFLLQAGAFARELFLDLCDFVGVLRGEGLVELLLEEDFPLRRSFASS